MMTFSEAVDYIFNIPKFTSKNEPDKTAHFLELIGDISETIPVVHVAGTNGKGSVCAFVESALRNSGLHTGMFTSPHLVSIRERFKYDDRMITEEEFMVSFAHVLELIDKVHLEEAYKDYHPTFFEFLFFMACDFYKTVKPDCLILETGLGGRLDATNSIKNPKVCVITEIGLDHMEYLGDTKEKIAFEKAGIIKKGVPVVCADRITSCTEVIKNRAKECGSECLTISYEDIKNLKNEGSGIDFCIRSIYDVDVHFKLETCALYQAENAAIAFRTLEVMGLGNREKFVEGIEKMRWPGRMEEIEKDVFIDGAHNPDGIEMFIKSVSNDGASKRKLLFSAVSDKQVEAITKMLIESGLFDEVYLGALNSARGADLNRLKECFKAARDMKQFSFSNVEEAFKSMCTAKSDGEKCYVVGSLYLVGEVLAIKNGK